MKERYSFNPFIKKHDAGNADCICEVKGYPIGDVSPQNDHQKSTCLKREAEDHLNNPLVAINI